MLDHITEEEEEECNTCSLMNIRPQKSLPIEQESLRETLSSTLIIETKGQ